MIKDDSPTGADDILPGATEAPERRIPSKFSFKIKGKTVAAKPRNRPEKAIPRSAGKRRQEVMIGPKIQEAINDGIFEANYPEGIIAPTRERRAKVAKWAQMRALYPMMTNIDIAKELGISPQTLTAYINSGQREGWLRFDNAIERMEYEIVPKVVDNLSKLLDKGDKTATIEAAKGTIFKTYQDSKGISDAPQTVLALKIEQATDGPVKIITGHIVGKSKAYMAGEEP